MINKYLKQYRSEANISIRELASQVGVSQAYISQIENEKKIPNLNMFFNILNSIASIILKPQCEQEGVDYEEYRERVETTASKYVEEIIDTIDIKTLENEREKQLILDIKKVSSIPFPSTYKDISTKIIDGEKLKIDLSYLNRKNVQLVIDGEQLTSDDITALTILIEGIRAKHK